MGHWLDTPVDVAVGGWVGGCQARVEILCQAGGSVVPETVLGVRGRAVWPLSVQLSSSPLVQLTQPLLSAALLPGESRLTDTVLGLWGQLEGS